MPDVTLRLSRSYQTRVDQTENVRVCAAMFGIGIDEGIRVTLYENLEVKLGRGRIIYITGQSGGGKTSLLRDIAGAAGADPRFTVIEMPIGAKAPLIDQFPELGVKATSELLNSVGISEAFIYLRRPEELSDGQRYRFQIAVLMHRAVAIDPDTIPIIIADEFLANLDRETARNVAYQVRRAASKMGLCFVVATTHGDIARDLQPNVVVRMRLNAVPERTVTPLAGA